MNKTEFKKEEIYDKAGVLLAIVLRDGEYPEGLKFYSKDSDFIQIGTWNYNSGRKIQGHVHQVFERKSDRTQEVVLVKSGKLKANIYNEEGDPIAAVVLTSGDAMVFSAGGHSFESLEDKTQIFEVKNGPYFGKEKDKKILYGKE